MNEAILFLEPRGAVLEIVRTAKKRGYQVIALMSDLSLLKNQAEPYKTAVPLIDSFEEIESWEDFEAIEKKLVQLELKYTIVGIYSGMDSCAILAARLRKKWGLPSVDPEVLQGVLDKSQLRVRLRELGLSQLKNFHQSVVETWNSWSFEGAAYFKPVRGFFSAYVVRCEGMEDLKRAQDQWKWKGPSDPPYVRNYLQSQNEYHLEEAFEGELLSVEGFSQGGEFKSIGLLSRILYSKDPVVEMGSCFPYPHPLENAIVERVQLAHQQLGILEGPTHTEVIVNQQGQVEIIDLNPRFVGADVLQSINWAFGIQIQEQLLDFAIGKQIEWGMNKQTYSCLQYFFLPPVDCFESIEFPIRPEVKFQTTFLAPGARNRGADRQLDYLGCYLTVMPTFQSALDRSRELRSEIRINGNQGGVF